MMTSRRRIHVDRPWRMMRQVYRIQESLSLFVTKIKIQ